MKPHEQFRENVGKSLAALNRRLDRSRDSRVKDMAQLRGDIQALTKMIERSTELESNRHSVLVSEMSEMRRVIHVLVGEMPANRRPTLKLKRGGA